MFQHKYIQGRRNVWGHEDWSSPCFQDWSGEIRTLKIAWITKGQIISKCLLAVIVSTKKPTNFFKDLVIEKNFIKTLRITRKNQSENWKVRTIETEYFSNFSCRFLNRNFFLIWIMYNGSDFSKIFKFLAFSFEFHKFFLITISFFSHSRSEQFWK